MSINKESFEKVIRKSTKILGSDLHPVELDDRINVTPINDVQWSGLRGQSFCTSTDPDVQEILAKYGQTGIKYSLQGEPDFSKVAIAKVRISDMTENMGHDYTSAIKRLLDTDFAKENGITTPPQMRAYIKEHNLTIHEGADGVSEYLIESKIHQTFRHYGGRGKIRGFENNDPDRLIQSKISEGVVNVNKTLVKGEESFNEIVVETNDFVLNQANKFFAEDIIELNKAGLDSAMRTAIFASTLSVTKNVLSIARGETEIKEATKVILVDTASASVMAYTTGIVNKTMGFDNKGDAVLLVMGVSQLSKQVFSYMQGKMDEYQLMENIAENSVYLSAAYIGKTLGTAVGGAFAGSLGAMVGQYVAEIITTAVCSEIVSTIRFSKEFDKKNQRIISLCRNAENEIRISQQRLEIIIQKENKELRDAIYAGFKDVIIGIQNNSYEKIENGLIIIGNKFNLSSDEIRKDKVTRNTLFQNTDEALIIE